ncbi:polysaccharide biosynthesis protein [Enterovibrio norvegicus]|uniref:polysaccharide biosynthesis protein n=1 Tax=Enterovibrio norvegicus TaxID=188144 RepID=UPI00352D42F0
MEKFLYFPIQKLMFFSRKTKRIITIMYDFFAVLASVYFAYLLRLDTTFIQLSLSEISTFLITSIVTVLSFIKLGMYRAVLRYMAFPAIGNIFLAMLFSTITLAVSGFLFQSYLPRSVPVIYAGLALCFLGGPRVLIRSYYNHYFKLNKPNVLIYGAGNTGRDLAYALQNGGEYHPIAFIDDDPAKQKSIILGLRVYSLSQMTDLFDLYQPVKILLAINNVDHQEKTEILNRVSMFPLEVQSVPSVQEIASGRSSIDNVKDIELEDLLGRDPVVADNELLKKCIFNKSVMVTGAGGSIGSELCRQILSQQPNTLVLYELNEYNLYQIEKELKETVKLKGYKTLVVAALGSVQRQNRIEKLMMAFCVDTVYHAAAYKHVPIVENNIVEGVRNNVYGTWYCAEAAVKCGIKDFVLISTDKAVRPTNVMGASKRMAELVLQGIAEREVGTNFKMVRFGNVLGSSGSVVPLFRQQIRKGGPVTVTHPEIIRYFMLIPEAAELVIQAGSMGTTGQVFVLDMGAPVKIVELAEKMIMLMGHKPRLNFDQSLNCRDHSIIDIEFSGLRPGEKLYEELLIGDNVEGTSHPKIMAASENMLSWNEVNDILSELDKYCHDFDIEKIVELLKSTPLGFHSDHKNTDLLFRDYLYGKVVNMKTGNDNN